MDNIDRFNASVTPNSQYAFKVPGGQDAHYSSVSPLVQTGPRPLYRFLYLTGTTPEHLDVNSDLDIVYVNGVLQAEPFEKLAYVFTEKKFAILLAYATPPDPYEQNPSIQVSEVNAFGTVNEANYDEFERIFKDRLIGAVNFRFTRDQNGLLTVESCVVNKGVIPDWS